MKTNRIREVREAAGMTLRHLADRIADQTGETVTTTQLSRLELGTRRLTVTWMQRIARALDCDPAMLLNQAAMSAGRDEVEPVDVDQVVTRALALRNLKLYKVKHSQVPLLLQNGAVITVDTAMTADPPPCSLVLAKIGGHLVVRQWVPPNRLVTAMPGGANTIVSLDDVGVDVEILGSLISEPSKG